MANYVKKITIINSKIILIAVENITITKIEIIKIEITS